MLLLIFLLVFFLMFQHFIGLLLSYIASVPPFYFRGEKEKFRLQYPNDCFIPFFGGRIPRHSESCFPICGTIALNNQRYYITHLTWLICLAKPEKYRLTGILNVLWIYFSPYTFQYILHFSGLSKKRKRNSKMRKNPAKMKI